MRNKFKQFLIFLLFISGLITTGCSIFEERTVTGGGFGSETENHVSVTGTLVRDGEPVANSPITVRPFISHNPSEESRGVSVLGKISNSLEDKVYRDTTDLNGRFTVLITPGTWLVESILENDGAALPFTVDTTAGESYNIPTNINVNPLSHLKGSTTLDPGTQVKIQGLDRTGIIDENREYRFDDIPEGTYVLQVEEQSRFTTIATTAIDNISTFSQSGTLVLASFETVTGWNDLYPLFEEGYMTISQPDDSAIYVSPWGVGGPVNESYNRDDPFDGGQSLSIDYLLKDGVDPEKSALFELLIAGKRSYDGVGEPWHYFPNLKSFDFAARGTGKIKFQVFARNPETDWQDNYYYKFELTPEWKQYSISPDSMGLTWEKEEGRVPNAIEFRVLSWRADSTAHLELDDVILNGASLEDLLR